MTQEMDEREFEEWWEETNSYPESDFQWRFAKYISNKSWIASRRLLRKKEERDE